MKGRKLFDDIFTPQHSQQKRKGRSSDLLAQRDRLLIHRYYYYGHYTSLRYTAVLDRLHQEHHLTHSRITKIISDHAEELTQLKEAPPTLKELRNEWPYLLWITI